MFNMGHRMGSLCRRGIVEEIMPLSQRVSISMPKSSVVTDNDEGEGNKLTILNEIPGNSYTRQR